MAPRTGMLANPAALFPPTRIWVGAVSWAILSLCALAGLIDIALIENVLLLAVLVIVPMVILLLSVGTHSRLTGHLISLQPIASITSTAALLIPAGIVAGLLTAPWVLLTGLLALSGVDYVMRHNRTLRIEDVAITAGLLYSAVGGGWLTISRSGLQPLEFPDVIVALTAVHFHYAGLTASIVIGHSGRLLRNAQVPLAIPYHGSVAGIVVGVLLVAVGITISPHLEVVGSLLIAISLTMHGILILSKLMPHLRHPLAKIILPVAMVSVIVGMGLASVYAVGEFMGQSVLSIPQMTHYHGALNAFGFSLGGLLAIALESNSLDHFRPI